MDPIIAQRREREIAVYLAHVFDGQDYNDLPPLAQQFYDSHAAELLSISFGAEPAKAHAQEKTA